MKCEDEECGREAMEGIPLPFWLCPEHAIDFWESEIKAAEAWIERAGKEIARRNAVASGRKYCPKCFDTSPIYLKQFNSWVCMDSTCRNRWKDEDAD
jgi:hypothetical protein